MKHRNKIKYKPDFSEWNLKAGELLENAIVNGLQEVVEIACRRNLYIDWGLEKFDGNISIYLPLGAEEASISGVKWTINLDKEINNSLMSYISLADGVIDEHALPEIEKLGKAFERYAKLCKKVSKKGSF